MPGMKKWITSNYHYMVPEFDGTPLQPNFGSYLADVRRGLQTVGVEAAAPVVIGPVTMAYLTKFASFAAGSDVEQRRELLKMLLPIYESLMTALTTLGVREIQIHEAALVLSSSLSSKLPILRFFPRRTT